MSSIFSFPYIPVSPDSISMFHPKFFIVNGLKF